MHFLIEGPLDRGGSNLDRVGLAETARRWGHRVTELLPEAALEPGQPRLPPFESIGFEWGVLFCDTPSPARYAGIVAEAAARKVVLLNDVTQHLDALELHRTVSRLDDLTARTVVVESVDALDAALERLPPPVFVKGSVGSRKRHGRGACVAEDVGQARALVEKLFALPSQARGAVLVRELLPLRHTGRVVEGFPQAREYRLFVLDADVIAVGPYWPLGDPFGALAPRELDEVQALAREVAARTRVPWLCVDVGQLDSGDWRVIETGDPCCSSLAGVAPAALVGALPAALEARAGC
jgi:hypothetical protein